MANGQDNTIPTNLPLNDPQVLASALTMSPGGALPATSPVQPGGLASMVQQVANLPQYQEPYSRLQDIGSQEQDIQNQMRGMAVPKMGFQPNFVHGQGIGGFFRNLGEGLKTMAASSLPGQAFQQQVYGPRIREYET